MFTSVILPFYFYRILGKEERFSFLRFFGYLLLGYVLSQNADFLAMGVSAFAVCGILMYGFSLNDYWDFKKEAEENTIASVLRNRVLGDGAVRALILLPLGFAALLIALLVVLMEVPAVRIIPWAAIGTALLTFYSLPPVRFKDRPGGSYLVSGLGGVILFFQAYTLGRTPEAHIVLFTVLLFLFQLWLHNLHVLGDFYKGDTVFAVTRKSAMRLLRLIPLTSFVLAVLFSLVNPVFLATAIFSLFRVWSWRDAGPNTNVNLLRRNLLGPHLALYEFLVYGGAAFAGFF